MGRRTHPVMPALSGAHPAIIISISIAVFASRPTLATEDQHGSSASSWRIASQTVIDFEQVAESHLLYRVDTATNATLESAYWAQSSACAGQAARVPHRELLLSPALLRLTLDSFGQRGNSTPGSVPFLFFADDNPTGESSAVWAVEWLPQDGAANFQQLTAAGSRRQARFRPVQLCHRRLPQLQQLRLRLLLLLRAHGAADSDLLDNPAELLAIASSALSCLLLCLMLWAFASLLGQVKRLRRSLLAVVSYRSLRSDPGADGSCSRVRYNGSTSVLQYSSIEARLDHERRMNSYMYY